MKDKWLNRYQESLKMRGNYSETLVGFNANLDLTTNIEESGLDLSDVEAREVEKVESFRELKSMVRYCMEQGENREVDADFDHEFNDTDIQVGGQAGIMSNFLARTGNGVIFYTPFLSQKLADMMDEKILYPVVEGGFKLKNIHDAPNSDRTKENYIIEYDAEETGRVIFSSSLRGFGPYFRNTVEDNLNVINQNIDRVILSGFHDAEGNILAKLKKSKEQIKKIDKPVHLEFVHRNSSVTEKVVETVFEEADSLGLDEDELRHLSEILNLNREEGITSSFETLRAVLKEFNMERIHLHTMKYHLTVVKESYDIDSEDIRDAMLYGEAAAIKMADIGYLPSKEDLESLPRDNTHLHNLDPVRELGEYLDEENMADKGYGENDELRVIAIPTLIHEDPNRLVGMGDIISSGAFTAEIQRD